MWIIVSSIIVSVILYFIFRIVSIKLDWIRSERENYEFLKKYKYPLSQMIIGCSFAQEEWSEEDNQQDKPFEALQFIVKTLNIKEIRFGIRWDKVITETGTFDFSYYKKCFDYCLHNNVSVCLNVGPIKVFRWPESHIPAIIEANLTKKLHDHEVVRKDSELSIAAIKYLEYLYDFFLSNYSKDELKAIKVIQIENEAFNGMGKLRLRMSQEHVKEAIMVTGKLFPKIPILVNSAGRFNLRKIVVLFKQIRTISTIPLIVGYDYYYKTPNRYKFILSKYIDSIHFSAPWDTSLFCLKHYSRKYNFKIEVTEAQFEPWGYLIDPGSRIRDLRFVILRCLQNILRLDPKKKSVLRLWGIEHLTKRALANDMTPEHLEMVKLIQSINAL